MTSHTTTQEAKAGRKHAWRWKGTWNEFKGKVRQVWGTVTDSDLDVIEGRYEEALGRVQRKTGEAIDVIYEKLS